MAGSPGRVAEQAVARHRVIVRALFVAVVLALIAQFAYAYRVEEPFPSFLFPDFQGAPDQGRPTMVLQPRLVVRFQGSTGAEHLAYQRLLDPVPGVVADAIAYSVFAPQPSVAHPRSTPQLFRTFLEQPPVAPHDTRLSSELHDPRTRRWLAARLAELYPGRVARSLTVLWDEHRAGTRGGEAHETVTTVARLELSLT